MDPAERGARLLAALEARNSAAVMAELAARPMAMAVRAAVVLLGQVETVKPEASEKMP